MSETIKLVAMLFVKVIELLFLLGVVLAMSFAAAPLYVIARLAIPKSHPAWIGVDSAMDEARVILTNFWNHLRGR